MCPTAPVMDGDVLPAAEAVVLWPQPRSSRGAGERRWRGAERCSPGRLCQPFGAGWTQVRRALSQALAFYQKARAEGGRLARPGLQRWGRAASRLEDHSVECKRTPAPCFGGGLLAPS